MELAREELAVPLLLGRISLCAQARADERDGDGGSRGVWVTNYLADFNTYATAYSSVASSLSISDVDISDVTTGVFVEDANADFAGNGPGDDATGAVAVTIDSNTDIDTNNGTGVLNKSGGTMLLSNNDLAFNTTGINNASGTVFTYGTNRNASTATAIMGTVTSAGQQ